MGINRGWHALVATASLNATAILFVLLRCISRFGLLKQAGPEDYLIVFAMIFSIGVTAIVALQAKHGMGQPIATLSLADIETCFKLLYAAAIVYNFGLLLVKTSILFQYLRFFADRRWRAAAWSLMAFTAAGLLSMILAQAFECIPVDYVWDKGIPGSRCVDTVALGFTVAAFNIVTDLAIWLLPMPILSRLQLPRKQKISLIMVFALGGFGCATAMLRLVSLRVLATSKDVVYDFVGAATWSAAELNVGIMCACIPALRPLVGVVFPRLLASTPRRSRPSAYHDPSDARADSVIELSQGPKGHTETSRDDNLSVETNEDPSIRVKQSWSVMHDQP